MALPSPMLAPRSCRQTTAAPGHRKSAGASILLQDHRMNRHQQRVGSIDSQSGGKPSNALSANETASAATAQQGERGKPGATPSSAAGRAARWLVHRVGCRQGQASCAASRDSATDAGGCRRRQRKRQRKSPAQAKAPDTGVRTWASLFQQLALRIGKKYRSWWGDRARVIGTKIKQMFESGQSCHAGRPWRPGGLWIGFTTF